MRCASAKDFREIREVFLLRAAAVPPSQRPLKKKRLSREMTGRISTRHFPGKDVRWIMLRPPHSSWQLTSPLPCSR